MKRKLVSFFIALGFSGVVMAGGILTNTNQSAMYIRMMARDATLGLDAVYFNPAGLSLLNDGFYLSINNQTLGQTRWITSNYSQFNNSEYTGKIFAPAFPDLFATYKKGNLAVSLGFMPIGGGGGAKYDKGLPSFEYGIANLVPSLSSYGVTGYSADISFEGTSVFFGYQANISYKINDMLSLAIGGRYVAAKNTYKGSIKNIMVTSATGTYTPGNYLRLVAQTPGLDAVTIAALNGFAATLDVATADREVDAEETGTGFTPIISLNIAASENLNFALKYEFNTKLDLTTKVKDGKDGGGLYTEGEKNRSDLPAQIVAGATYKPVDKLLISTGVHYYMDKQADWGGLQDSLSGNSYEFALGLEYAISENFKVSTGYLFTKSGAVAKYQSDVSYSLPSNTIGAGFAYRISPAFELNLAGSYTMYTKGDKAISIDPTGMMGPLTPTTETYDKDVWIVAVGLNFNFGAAK